MAGRGAKEGFFFPSAAAKLEIEFKTGYLLKKFTIDS
jgi:hypothetical protein